MVLTRLGEYNAKNETGAETVLPNIDEYPQRKDLLEQEFEYITSDKIAGGVNRSLTYFLTTRKRDELVRYR